AYRVELEGAATDWLRGRAYWRHTDPGFTNNATTSFVPGQTRYGAEAAIALSDNTSIRARYDREENEGTAPRPLLNLDDLLDVGNFPVPGSQVSNSLDTFSLGFAHRLGDSNLEFDWLHRERTDRLASNALSASSDQLRTRLTTAINEDITLVAQNEINLSSNSDPLYPNRTIFGLNWRLMPGLVLGVNQIFQEDQTGSPETITTVDLSGEYALAQDTTIHGRFSLIEGQQVGGAIGLEQGFTLAPGLKLDLAYEHIFNNFSGSTAAGTQFTQPFAVGDGASSLLLTNGDSFSVGLSYTDNPDLQASARFEHRSSSQGSNTVFTAAALGRLSPAVTVLFNYETARAANQSLGRLGTTSTLKLGLAYRNPYHDQFNALLRYEYRRNPNTLPDTLLFGSDIGSEEHIFVGEAIYAPNWRWEIYGKYAFRSSTTQIGGLSDVGDVTGVDEFSSTSSIHLAQLRATYRLGYSWDVVGEARWLGSSVGYGELGGALELGYYPTPDLRLSAGYSFGSAYDRDFSGTSRSAGGLYVGVTAKLNNLFGGFGLQEVAPPQQQEAATASPEN
ncbi:MAG: TonB-dependent receptor, partial [Leptolyngbyaceae cyanobacterium SM1_1_3]|nr:TonB-dependent receptor [Leptolyngbyaceae cyanobacterium SM1_1_3]